MTTPHNDARAQWIADQEARARKHGFTPLPPVDDDRPVPAILIAAVFTALWLAFCAVLAVAAWFLAADAAEAQTQNCGPIDGAVRGLVGQFQEAPMIELHGGAAILQVWINPETETWTILVLRPGGIACWPASGTGFELLAMPPQGVPG